MSLLSLPLRSLQRNSSICASSIFFDTLNNVGSQAISASSSFTSFPHPFVSSSSSFTSQRYYSSSRSLYNIEEFIAVRPREGQPPQRAGRPWTAAELRKKSFQDLHGLWFVCLKEKNALLTERLYYKQVLQEQPEKDRLHKVKRTMAMIKVVLGERVRAASLLKENTLMKQKIDTFTQTFTQILNTPEQTTSADDKGTSPPPHDINKLTNSARTTAQNNVKERLKDKVMVTYKKFGRKYTVTKEQESKNLGDTLPPSQRKRIINTGTYFKRIKQLNNAPLVPVPVSPSYVYGTTGITVQTQRKQNEQKLYENAGLKKSTAHRGATSTPPPA